MRKKQIFRIVLEFILAVSIVLSLFMTEWRIISAVSAGIFVIVMFLSNKKISIKNIAYLVVLSFFLIMNFVTYLHGYEPGESEKIKIGDDLKICLNSGVVDRDFNKDSSDFNGKIIIYEKYGCKDCYSLHKQYTEYLDNAGIDYIFVSTRSKNGKELLKYYPVDEVPSIIRIPAKGSNDFYKCTLHINGVFNESGLKAFINNINNNK